MSHLNETLLNELNTLQSRIDELRVMLRREATTELLPEGLFDILLCRAVEEHVALPVTSIDEVLPICRLTPVPDAAKWFAGLLNLGGEMLPILDLSARITGRATPVALSNAIVICMVGGAKLGLVVSEVTGIQRINRDDVQNVPDTLVSAPFLLGVAEIGDKAALFLNLTSVRHSTEFSRVVC